MGRAALTVRKDASPVFGGLAGPWPGFPLIFPPFLRYLACDLGELAQLVER